MVHGDVEPHLWPKAIIERTNEWCLNGLLMLMLCQKNKQFFFKFHMV